MNRTKLVFAGTAFVALLALIGWLAGAFSEKIDPTLLEPVRHATPEAQIHTTTLTDVVMTESIPATIAARVDTTISSRILARILSVNVKAGDPVEKGGLLIELEQADLGSRVQQAKDQVASTSAQLEDVRLRRERAAELLSRGLAARAEVDSLNATYDSLASQLAIAKEALAETEIVLGYSTIRSPIDGRVIERLAEPGDTVSPGTPLLSLYDPLSIRAEAAVREGLALTLALGEEIEVEIGALNQTVSATIEEIVPAADPGSRSFLVKAGMEFNPALMPGMFARFIVPTGTLPMLLIPASATIEVGELDFVTVVADGRLERRFVRLGRSQPDGMIVVTSGLNPGEQILIDPTGS